MKTLFIALLALMGSVYAGTPSETLVPISHVYSPMGFDTNDSTEILVEGFLPNLCHRNPMTSYKVSGKRIDIKVMALRYDESNPYCPEMLVPFLEKVEVGILDKGQYEIFVNGKTMFEYKGKIRIVESSNDAVDDYVYANVEYVEKNTGSRTVSFKGYNPSECFVLDKVEFIDNGVDTYSVLPKMRQVSDFCPLKMTPFSFDAEVPNTLKKDKVLLHVRVMDGKSVNTLFRKER